MRTALPTLVAVVVAVACAKKNDVPSGEVTETAETAEAADTVPEAPAVRSVDVEEAAVRDLEAVQKAGVLRALVVESDPEALAASTASTPDRDAARALAASLGLGLRFVTVPRRDGLLPALLAGRGDFVADGMSAAPGAALSKPLRHVDLLVVTAARNAKGLRGPRDLGGRSVLVSPPTAAEDVLKTIGGRKPVSVQPPKPTDDLDASLGAVAAGDPFAVIIESDLWETYGTDDLVRAFSLVERQPLAWAVHPANKNLLSAMDTFVFEWTLTAHQGVEGLGDLDQIQKRKVLRVAMLNNAASYFVYRGQEVGYQFELAHLLARRLSLRLQVVVPEKPGDMPSMLERGIVDVIPLAVGGSPDSSPATPGPALSFSEPFDTANIVVVQKATEAPIVKLEELAGKTVHVRQSSRYAEILKAMADKLPGLKVVWAPEEAETEELIDQVAKGTIPLTLSNSALLGAELTWRDDIKGTLVLAENSPLAYAVRSGSPRLLERLNRFVERDAKGEVGKELHAKYFENALRMRELVTEGAMQSGRISPFDDFAKKYGQEYKVDWRLVLAQMYQESRFDPRARSWVGAMGLMQLMPKTARQLGVKNARDPEQNVEGGVKYMSQLINEFEPSLDVQQRVRMALAAYNAGMSHVKDARKLAKKKGWDPDRWFGNVENAIVLLERPQYYRRARFGYCRGREPQDYVSRIQTKYDAYVAALTQSGSAQ